jgi:peroxiredoxin
MKWRSLEEAQAGNNRRPLREILAERKEATARYVPAETEAIHRRAIEELREQRVAERALAIGAQAPGFVLNDQSGKPVNSGELISAGKLVLCFIRGRWDPFCCGQMEAMNLVLPQIAAAGASFLAISPQTVAQSYFMADQHKLRFPLLSDQGNAVARQFGLVYRVPDYQEAIYRRAFINLPFINGENSWELPIPATYIVDQRGGITFSSINPDYTERPEPLEIVEMLRRQESRGNN